MRPDDAPVRFGTHAEAWEHFGRREAPLRAILDLLSDDPRATLTVWLVPVDERLRPPIAAVQEAMAGIPFLRRIPDHFLHVTVAGSEHARPDAGAALAGLEPFPIRVARTGAFAEAVIAEVEGDGLREAARRLGTPPETYVPHVSLAYTWAPGPVEPVRAVVRRWRHHEIGEQLVDEILLCEVPASRTTLLQPWRVVERVRLGGG
jgi:2'-5' RNA ligase